ncbi:MAG: hypothetical protein IKG40_01495 [Bacilli bacterium]|nr:hypothetical protein [Bacilli bacterium]
MPKKKEEDSVKKVKEVKTTSLNNSEIDIDLSGIKTDLTEYMQNKIDKEVESAVDKSVKKFIRYKNTIILKKNIIIIILLIICAFLSYNLYKISDININISTNKKAEIKEEKKTEEKKEEKVEDTEKVDKKSEFENKKKEFKNLIEDIYISEDSSYIKDYYEGNLTDEIKLYLAMNKMDNDSIVSEDESIYIESDNLKESYDIFFEDDFNPKSFEYNGLKFHYLSSKSMFISDGKYEKIKNNISKEIVDIKEEKELVITTVEGIVKDEKLYNIISKKEIKNYKNDSLDNYKKDLNVLTYHFKKVDDDYKLIKISK